MDRVSVIIPCYNPGPFLPKAIASARAQAGCASEVILVDDGTDRPESRQMIERARPLADLYLEQPNHGLASARNAGFRAATCESVIPLDSDDLLEPGFAVACLQALATHPGAAFAYSDYRVFGTKNYVQRLPDYCLYGLLDRNTLPYAAVIRRRDWEECGGYDESMSGGYEDWEFWLRLGERRRFGHHVGQVLFAYRKHGRSLFDTALERDTQLVDYIRLKHPALYGKEARATIKRHWSPAVCIAAAQSQIGRQTISDWAPVERRAAAPGNAFLVPGSALPLGADSAELAALAVWGGRQTLQLPDGSVALSRKSFRKAAPGRAAAERSPHQSSLPGHIEQLRRHWSNAGLDSPQIWVRHPLRSAGRLIPLRVKERTNEVFGRRLFDLSFYLQFRPTSIHVDGAVHQPLFYIPETPDRKRIAFVTPHLGPGGAEAVLLQICNSLDRGSNELFLLATQSHNDTWRKRWEDAVDHVYDLQKLVGFDKAGAAVYSIAANWEVQALLVQNSLTAYSVLPHLKRRLPSLQTIDLIHSLDEDWDMVAATREVSDSIDIRVAISEAVRGRLRQGGTPDSKIRLIRNSVDLRRFSPCPSSAGDGIHRILFAGRLEPEKRPLLLPEIAAGLRRLRDREDFRFVVAGDGSERAVLAAQVRKQRLENVFDMRGWVEDIAPLLAECELVIVPSRAEGIPLIALEAFACHRTVVASAVGGVPEIVTPETGILISHGPREIHQFADALHELLEQPQLRETRAETGRKLVEQLFERERFAGEYRDLLGDS